jgi:hypothetical protein
MDMGKLKHTYNSIFVILCKLLCNTSTTFLLFSSLIWVAVRVFGLETIEASVVDENLRADEVEKKGTVHNEQVACATAHATGKSERFATIWKENGVDDHNVLLELLNHEASR